MLDVTRSVDIRATPERVWRELASEFALRRWLAADLEIDLRVGGRYRMTGEDGTTPISGKVLELVPAERLVLSWLEEDGGWSAPARLSIEVKATPEGSTVVLRHDGFEAIGRADWQRIARAYEAGAARHPVLGRLAEAVLVDA